jgi:RND family efflux transporter MFP subunit
MAALAGIACACSGGESGGEAKAKGAPPPALVEVEKVTSGDLTDGWSFLGRVEPALSANLAPAVAGHVLKVTAREGDRIDKGAVLLSLDSAKARAVLSAAQARLEGLEIELLSAQRQHDRVKKLDYPTVSEPERERYELVVDNLKAQVQTQRAEAQRVRVELAQHTIRAPFAGAVRSRGVDPGAWVNAGQAVMELVSLDEVEIHVDVTAELGARLIAGDAATIKGAEPLAATIAGVVPALDTETRTMHIRLLPESKPAWLIAGMAIDVEFAVKFEGEGVTVPRDAVIRGPVDSRVIKADGDKGVPISVEVIAMSNDKVLIRAEGLAVGDAVVVRGNERLRPGQTIQVKKD